MAGFEHSRIGLDRATPAVSFMRTDSAAIFRPERDAHLRVWRHFFVLLSGGFRFLPRVSTPFFFFPYCCWKEDFLPRRLLTSCCRCDVRKEVSPFRCSFSGSFSSPLVDTLTTFQLISAFKADNPVLSKQKKFITFFLFLKKKKRSYWGSQNNSGCFRFLAAVSDAAENGGADSSVRPRYRFLGYAF